MISRPTGRCCFDRLPHARQRRGKPRALSRKRTCAYTVPGRKTLWSNLPKAYLAAVATRLAIDHLRSARVRRESYVGHWLPEPIVEVKEPPMAHQLEMAESSIRTKYGISVPLSDLVRLPSKSRDGTKTVDSCSAAPRANGVVGEHSRLAAERTCLRRVYVSAHVSGLPCL